LSKHTDGELSSRETETYNGNEKLSTVLREIPWSHNLQIMSCKMDEEREFYGEEIQGIQKGEGLL